MATKVAVQLISWGGRAKSDLRGVLGEVRDVGYAGVEIGLDVLRRAPVGPEEFGLQLVGVHLGGGDMELAEEAMELSGRFGGRFLIFSGIGERTGDIERDYGRGAEFLNEVGRLARGRGLTVLYHNHAHEFEQDGTGMRLLLRETEPELVGLAVDVCWVYLGRRDPVEFLRENLDRVKYVHFKDFRHHSSNPFAEVGSGILDFPGIWEVLKPLELEWVCVEQDRTDLPPKQSAGKSRRYIKENLGI